MTPQERSIAEAVLLDAANSMEDFEQVARKWGLTPDWSKQTDIYGPPEVSPEPGGVLDRDQAREAMLRLGGPDVTVDSIFMDALAGCVRPAAIDRDALLITLNNCLHSPDDTYDLEKWADVVLALVRPVAGVTLTPEDTAMLRKILSRDLHTPQLTAAENHQIDVLAARLEAGS